MTRVFFREELETVATYWWIFRRDGVTLGFTSHNRDLVFDSIRHRAAPGMLPSAIRRTAELAREDVEVEGILSHDAISAEDLQQGRFDGARIAIGVVDWETREAQPLFHGAIESVSQDADSFIAELLSAKAALEADTVPRTSPTCRAQFCDAHCRLSAAHFTHVAKLESLDLAENSLLFSDAPDPAAMLHGSLRWLDGPQSGVTMQVLSADAAGLVLDRDIDPHLATGTRALLREGCDHTLATCGSRFGNAVNFQGEPFLPGNDFLTRYPSS